VPGYFDFMWNRVEIAFLPRYEDKYPNQQKLQLTLSLKMDYDSVLLALGSALSYNPAKIRLFSTSPNNVSMKYSIKRDPKQKLLDILGNNQYGPPSYTFFYELLEVSLIELESMKTVSTTFIDEEGKQSGPHPLLIPKAAKFEELIKIYGKIIKLPANYRIFEVVQSRKQRVFKLDDFITLLNEFGLLVVEAISDEEVQIQETEPERIIHGFHFSKETFRAHGIPFTFILNQVNQNSNPE
jgi:ubiquitin carboxyl-terminal hydrolase 7